METPQETLKKLPHTPGIYIYRDAAGTIIYIGKAKDLKKRVSQYFVRDDAVGEKTKLLVSQIVHIETIGTASEFDALLLEAKLIHDHTPKYNVVLKDDKSPLYILLTISEELPRVIFVRRSDIPKDLHKEDVLFGPFQSARTVRTLMRHLRHSIPYCTQKIRSGRPCFYTHIGLCYPCPSYTAKLPAGDTKKTLTHRYRNNIYRLKDILSGKSTKVLDELEHEMKTLAKEEHFEEANRCKNYRDNLLAMLQKSYDPTLYIASEGAVEDIHAQEQASLQNILHPYFPALTSLARIECVDISNTQGTHATGSLVVLTDGVKDTSQYKRFRIRRENAPNDFAMIAEVVRRRFAHPEWGTPDLFIVDGGKGQITAALSIFAELGIRVPLVGLAKRYEEIIVPLGATWKTIRIPFTNPALHLVQRIRDEAHRFALTYHRLLRKKSFIQ